MITTPRGRPRRPFRMVKGHKYFECTNCFIWKERNQFYRLSVNHPTKCGRMSECKSCNDHRRRGGEKRGSEL